MLPGSSFVWCSVNNDSLGLRVAGLRWVPQVSQGSSLSMHDLLEGPFIAVQGKTERFHRDKLLLSR